MRTNYNCPFLLINININIIIFVTFRLAKSMQVLFYAKLSYFLRFQFEEETHPFNSYLQDIKTQVMLFPCTLEMIRPTKMLSRYALSLTLVPDICYPHSLHLRRFCGNFVNLNVPMLLVFI